MPEQKEKLEKPNNRGSLSTKEREFLKSKQQLWVKDVDNELYRDLLSANMKVSNDSKINAILKLENFGKYPALQKAMQWRFAKIDKEFVGNTTKIQFYKNIALAKAILGVALRNIGQGALASEIDFTKENASNFQSKSGQDLERQIFSASFIKCLHKFQKLTQDNNNRSQTDCIMGPKTIQQILSYANYNTSAQKEVNSKLDKKYTDIDYNNPDNVQKDINTIKQNIDTKDIHKLQGFLSHLNNIATNTNGEIIDKIVDPLRKQIIDKIIILASILPPIERQKIINNMDNVIEGDSQLKQKINEARKTKIEQDQKNEYDNVVGELTEELADKGVTKDMINSLAAKIQKIIAVYGISSGAISKIEQLASSNPALFNKIISKIGPFHSGLKLLTQNPIGSKLLMGSQALAGAFQRAQLYNAVASGNTVGEKAINVGKTAYDFGKYMIPIVGNVYDYNDAYEDFGKGDYGSCAFNAFTGSAGMILDVMSIISSPTIAGPVALEAGKVGLKTGMKLAIKSLKEGKGVMIALKEAKGGIKEGAKAIEEGGKYVAESVQKLITNPKAREELLLKSAEHIDDALKYIDNAPKMMESAVANMGWGEVATRAMKYIIKETFEGMKNSLMAPFKLLFGGLDIKGIRQLLKKYKNKDIKPVKGNVFGGPDDISTPKIEGSKKEPQKLLDQKNIDKKDSQTNNNPDNTPPKIESDKRKSPQNDEKFPNKEKNQVNMNITKREIFDKISNCKTKDELKKIYRDYAKVYHPDKTNGDKTGEEIFKELAELNKQKEEFLEGRGPDISPNNKNYIKSRTAENQTSNNKKQESTNKSPEDQQAERVAESIKNAEKDPNKISQAISDLNMYIKDMIVNFGKFSKEKLSMYVNQVSSHITRLNKLLIDSRSKLGDIYHELMGKLHELKAEISEIIKTKEIIKNHEINKSVSDILKFRYNTLKDPRSKIFIAMYLKGQSKSGFRDGNTSWSINEIHPILRSNGKVEEGVVFGIDKDGTTAILFSNKDIKIISAENMKSNINNGYKEEMNAQNANTEFNKQNMNEGNKNNEPSDDPFQKPESNWDEIYKFAEEQGYEAPSTKIKSEQVNIKREKASENNSIKPNYEQKITKEYIDIRSFDNLPKSDKASEMISIFGKPTQKIELGGQEFYVGNTLRIKGNSRDFNVAYVFIDGKIETRVFYKSNSEGVWRSCPGSRGSGGYSKGEAILGQSYQTTTKVHPELEMFFNKNKLVILENVSDPVKELGLDNSSGIEGLYGHNMVQMKSETNVIKKIGVEGFEDFLTYHDDESNRNFIANNPTSIFKHKTSDKLKNFYAQFDGGVNFENMKLINGVEINSYHSLLKTNIKTQIFESSFLQTGEKINIYISKSDDGKYWIDNIVYPDAKVNSFGMYDKQINPGMLSMKPIDYNTGKSRYVPSDYINGENVDKYRVNDQYSDIRDLYQENPILKRAKEIMYSNNAVNA